MEEEIKNYLLKLEPENTNFFVREFDKDIYIYNKRDNIIYKYKYKPTYYGIYKYYMLSSFSEDCFLNGSIDNIIAQFDSEFYNYGNDIKNDQLLRHIGINCLSKIICGCCGRILDFWQSTHVDKENIDLCMTCYNEYYVYDYSICDVARKENMLYHISIAGSDYYWSTEEGYLRDTVLDEYSKERIPKHDYRIIYIDGYGYTLRENLKKIPNVAKCMICGKYVIKDKLTNRICEDCMSKKDDCVRGYHCNPTRFYFLKNRVCKRPRKFAGFGIELEVQKKDDAEGRAREDYKVRDEILDALNTPYPYSKLYFMSDGSIGNGFEIITQPHTQEELLKIDWENILNILRKSDYQSHNGNRCGLHIHSSRLLYGDTREEQDDNIAKVIYFYEKFYDDMFKFSRRTSSGWAHPYFRPDDSDVVRGKELTKDNCERIVKGDMRIGRYRTVNVTNRSTIEFRIFRGTLILNSFLSALDITFNLIKNAKTISWDEVDDVSKWLNGINDTTKNYIKERNCFTEVIK